MATRNVFETMQAELHPQNDSDDDEESSEDESVPPESSDSEDDAVEEDLRERTDEEEIDNSNEDMSAHVIFLIDLTGKDGTVWQSTPPPRTRTQQHNIVRSRAKPTNLPGVLTDVVQAFRLYICDKVLNIIVTNTNMEAKRVYDKKYGDSKWKSTELKFWPTKGL